MTLVVVRRNPLHPKEEERILSPPDSVADLCPHDLRGRRDVYAFLNSRMLDGGWDEERAGERDVVHFCVRPGGAELAIQIGINLLIAAATFAVARLFALPEASTKRGDRKSKYFSFGGLQNDRVEGLPIPVSYGRVRLAGTVLNEYVDVQGVPSTTTLYMLIGFGEGDFLSIAGVTEDSSGLSVNDTTGIKINGNSLENYDDVRVWIRLGKNQQSSIPIFSKLYTNYEVGSRLTAPKSNQINKQSELHVTGDPFTTDYDDKWDDFAVSFDITDEVDGFRVRVQFPEGLFSTEEDGSLSQAVFKPQFRYRELDAGNSPITTGGPNNDGWVRVAPEVFLGNSDRGVFERQYEHAVIDPQTWELPTAGFCLDSGTSSGLCTMAIGLQWNNYNYIIPEWTWSFWFRLDAALPASPAHGTVRAIVGNYATDTDVGFSLYFIYRTDLTGSQSAGWVLRVFMGGGTDGGGQVIGQVQTDSDARIVDWGDPNELGKWHLLTVTYGAKKVNGDDRLRIFVDDQKDIGDTPSGAIKSIDFRIGAVFTGDTDPIHCFRDPNGANFIEASFDDLLLIEDEVGLGFIVDRFNSQLTGEHNNLVARWKFDDSGADEDSGSGGGWGDGTLSGSATSGSTTGIVRDPEVGTPKRMKIRLECLRLNFDSTNTHQFDDADWLDVAAYVDADLAYPNEPLLGLSIRATEQLNTTEPDVTVECDARKVLTLRSVNPISTLVRWSSNPAWVAMDLLLNTRYGLGQHYSIEDLDLQSFLDWANYCDGVVYDGSIPDGPDLGTGWVDILFDNTTTGPDPDNPGSTITRGSLTFIYSPSSNTPPNHYVADKHVRPTAVSVVGAGADINVGTEGGYKISRVYWNITHAAWGVEAYWDRLSETDPWTSGTLYSTHQTPDGQATGGHERFAFNGTFEEERTAWDALLQLCAVGRAVPVREGKRIRIVYQRPQAHVAVIGRGSIVDGSFEIEYTSGADKPNVLVTEFLNEEQQHDKDYWTTLSADLVNAAQASLSDYRPETAKAFGITHRAQVERRDNFALNVNRILKRAGSFEMTMEGLHLEPGDVALLAHDILPRGVSGRAKMDASPDKNRLVADHEFELESGETYKLYIRDPRFDTVEVQDVDVSATGGVGTYPAGSVIVVTANFSGEPAPGLTAYVLVKDGDELLVTITGIEQAENMRKKVKWIEYDATIFDDVASETTESNFFGNDPNDDRWRNSPFSDQPLDANRADDARLLDGPVDLLVKDRVAAKGGGGRTTRLGVSWRWQGHEVARVGGVRVFARVATPNTYNSAGVPQPVESRWWLVGEEEGPATSSSIELPRAAVAGTVYDVAVQGVTKAGTRRRPDRCPIVRHSFRGLGRGPAALGNVAAEQVNDKLRLSWVAPTVEQDLQAEVRRGGWVLGTTVWVGPASDGLTPWLSDWAGAVSGEEFGTYVAARASSGAYGLRTRIEHTPAPFTLGIGFPTMFAAQAWEEYADGWKTDTSPPAGDPTLTNLQRHADGYLEFSGGVSGNYQTWDAITTPPTNKQRQPVRAYVEATIEAEQIHPATWDSMGLAWGDPEFARWTWEGPAWIVTGESQCQIILQWRYTSDGTNWGSYSVFRSGTYDLADCQFRLLVRRPTTDYQVRIHRFHTRVQVVGRSAQERSHAEAFIAGEMFQ